MDNAMASAGRAVYPINPKHEHDPRPEVVQEHRRRPRRDRPRDGRHAGGHRARRARAVRGRRRARRDRRVGGLLGDRRKGCAARQAHPRDPARQPHARRRPELPRHHPPDGRPQRLVPPDQARAGQHRAHLAERRAGHRHARLGDRRPRRLLDVRLGGRDGRRRLRRPHRLPRRGRADAQHPHLHGEHRRRAALHERGARVRAQQADHRAQARPLRRERCASRSPTPARWPAATRSTRPPSAEKASCACTRSPTCSTRPPCSTRTGCPGAATSRSSPTPAVWASWPPTRSSSTAGVWRPSRRRRWPRSTRRCRRTGATRNPIDVLGDAGSDRFVAAVSACLADDERQRHPAHLHAAGKRAPRRDGATRSRSS